MAKIYPYGFFKRSNVNLTNGSGNYTGSIFYVPAFLDTVILDGFSGNIVSGNFILEKNGSKRYPITIGLEKNVLVEPGDYFRLLLENGHASNVLYNYQIGFRYQGITDNIEISESSSSSS